LSEDKKRRQPADPGAFDCDAAAHPHSADGSPASAPARRRLEDTASAGPEQLLAPGLSGREGGCDSIRPGALLRAIALLER
jgi:hypothetical protein